MKWRLVGALLTLATIAATLLSILADWKWE
jgi:hypothetical protein